jgi:hypothetical protein
VQDGGSSQKNIANKLQERKTQATLPSLRNAPSAGDGRRYNSRRLNEESNQLKAQLARLVHQEPAGLNLYYFYSGHVTLLSNVQNFTFFSIL